MASLPVLQAEANGLEANPPSARRMETVGGPTGEVRNLTALVLADRAARQPGVPTLPTKPLGVAREYAADRRSSSLPLGAGDQLVPTKERGVQR